MKAVDAVRRLDVAAGELLAIHDAIKHGEGIVAEWPYEHRWNAHEVVDLLEIAAHNSFESARLIAKHAERETLFALLLAAGLLGLATGALIGWAVLEVAA